MTHGWRLMAGCLGPGSHTLTLERRAMSQEPSILHRALSIQPPAAESSMKSASYEIVKLRRYEAMKLLSYEAMTLSSYQANKQLLMAMPSWLCGTLLGLGECIAPLGTLPHTSCPPSPAKRAHLPPTSRRSLRLSRHAVMR